MTLAGAKKNPKEATLRLLEVGLMSKCQWDEVGRGRQCRSIGLGAQTNMSCLGT